MSQSSHIEWINGIRNPVTTDRKVSSSSGSCYAATSTECLRGVKGHSHERGFEYQQRPKRLEPTPETNEPRLVWG